MCWCHLIFRKMTIRALFLIVYFLSYYTLALILENPPKQKSRPYGYSWIYDSEYKAITVYVCVFMHKTNAHFFHENLGEELRIRIRRREKNKTSAISINQEKPKKKIVRQLCVDGSLTQQWYCYSYAESQKLW